MTVTAPIPGATRAGPWSRLSPAWRRRALTAATSVGLLLWVLAAGIGGPKGAGVASAISLAVTVGVMARPGIRTWLLNESPTGDIPPRQRGPFVTDLARRTTGTRTRELVTASVMVVVTVLVAAGAATVGEKAIVIVTGIIALLAFVASMKNRTLFFMFALSASFSFIMYKKFTPLLAESYLPAIYLTTVNVLQIFQYALWGAEGTLFRDLKEGLRDKIFMLPIAGIAITLLSAVNAPDQRLVWAEMVRYFWMTALFVYVGIRVRRREHVWAIMGGLLVFLMVQVAVATSQKMTGGFLGIPDLALRPDPEMINAGTSLDYQRPFGTQIHPVFLACVVMMIALLMGSFALHLASNRLSKYFLFASVPLAIACTAIARARGPLTALVPALAVIAVLGVRRKLIPIRILVVGALLSGLGAAIFHQQASAGINSLFGAESNFRANWDLRWKLNVVGYRMVVDHPFVGVGINSFEGQIRKYTVEENAFDFRPAHNYFVVMGAETGLVGLALVVVIGAVFIRYAYRLTRRDDPFYVGLGIGALALFTFVVGEELNSFTLKQDVPLALFWLVFGLVVAANRMADANAPALPRVRWIQRPGIDGAEPAGADAGADAGAGEPALPVAVGAGR